MIKLKNVSKIIGQNTILKDINLHIKRGEFVAILGKSGSGKSTLLNIIGTNDEISFGEYFLDKNDIKKLNNDEKSKIRQKYLGFVFQRYNLLTHLNVLENVALPCIYSGISKSSRTKIAIELLEKLDLKSKIYSKINELSGGQQQRVSIARALANNASVILADEPTGALDSKSGVMVMEILKKLHKDGKTIVLVTHDEELSNYANRRIIIEDGRIVKDECKTIEIYEKKDEKEVKKSNFTRFISSFKENIFMSIISIKNNKLRSFLTTLGLIISTISVILTMSLGNGTKKSVLEELNYLGTNTISFYKGRKIGDRESHRLKKLTIDDADFIKKFDFVEYVGVESRLGGKNAYFNGINADVEIIGVLENFLKVQGKKIENGRFFLPNDIDEAKNICVIDKNAVKTFFKNENPIGKTIIVNNIVLQVVGVVEKGSEFGRDIDINIYIPFSTLSKKFTNTNEVWLITAKLKDDINFEFAQEVLKNALAIKRGEDSIMSFSSEQIKKTIEKTANSMTLMVSCIAAIAMLVGGIGVMNIMLVIIKERTKEIGLKLAIGARGKDIGFGFLCESVILCMFGASFGVFLSILGAFGFNKLGLDFKMLLDLQTILIGFLSSVLVGIIFGYFPARSASKLLPIKALSE